MKKIIIFILSFLAVNVLSAYKLEFNKLYYQDKSSEYRTGQPDAAVSTVPEDIKAGLKKDPEKYLPLLAAYLKNNADNQFHLVKRIHDFITDNIAYNTDQLYGREAGVKKPFDILKEGKTTCGGFSRLFEAVAKEAGIDAVIVSGYSKTFSSNKEWGNHVWNAVKIEGKYYIVDCSADNRFSYKNGKFTKKRSYYDQNLFSRTEYKPYVNYPYKKEQFYSENAYSLDEFKADPQFRQLFYGYGLSFKEDIKSMTSKFKKGLQDTKYKRHYDFIEVGSPVLKLHLNAPDNVSLKTVIDADKELDDTGEGEEPENKDVLKRHAYNYREAGQEVILFSYPKKGIYTCTLLAKFNDRPDRWHTVYVFKIEGQSDTATVLPMEEQFLAKAEFYSAELKLQSENIRSFKEDGFLKIKIANSNRLKLNCNVKDSQSETQEKGSCLYGHKDGVYTFYFKPLSEERQVNKIYQIDSQNQWKLLAEIALNTLNVAPKDIPSQNELLVFNSFYDENLELVSETVSGAKAAEYIIKINSKNGKAIKAEMIDKSKARQKKVIEITNNGTVYTIKIRTPSQKGDYMVRLFKTLASGKTESIMAFRVVSD